MNIEEQMAAARRLIEGDGNVPSAKQIAEGAKIVRELAENADCLDAWRYMLDCHERGIGPFKTNKFRRNAKAAIARQEALLEWAAHRKLPPAADLSWCDIKTVREAMLHQYNDARRQRDKFVDDLVMDNIPETKYMAAARRIGLDWGERNNMSQTEEYAVIEFVTMYDDSEGYVALDRALEETRRGVDVDYDAAMQRFVHLRYTWSKVLDIREGFGLKCCDMLTGDEFFMVERSLSMSPELKGAVIASGIMPLGDCFMHTGFSLPFPGDNEGDGTVEGILKGVLEDLKVAQKRPIVLTKAQMASFAAVTIHSWLSSGACNHVRLEYR